MGWPAGQHPKTQRNDSDHFAGLGNARGMVPRSRIVRESSGISSLHAPHTNTLRTRKKLPGRLDTEPQLVHKTVMLPAAVIFPSFFKSAPRVSVVGAGICDSSMKRITGNVRAHQLPEDGRIEEFSCGFTCCFFHLFDPIGDIAQDKSKAH